MAQVLEDLKFTPADAELAARAATVCWFQVSDGRKGSEHWERVS